jgi:hypothetical protein
LLLLNSAVLGAHLAQAGLLLGPRKYEAHLDKQLALILANLSLIPEDLTEKGETRTQNEVELNFTLVEHIRRGQLRDIEGPT